MCGRFTLRQSADEVAREFQVQQVLFDPPPRYNIAPSQPISAIHQNGARVLEAFRWGLVPSWARDPEIGNRLINARGETLLEKPAFKRSVIGRRCVIPADGFYEWKKEGPDRGPYYIRMRDGGVFGLAGLWDEWESPDGSPLRTCTIITVAPNKTVGAIHNRMPAIVRNETADAWLDPARRDPGSIMALLRPYPDEALVAVPVSPRVNNPGSEGEACIAPLA